MFPPDLFEKFIDVGHYVRELNSYKVLVDKISALTVNLLNLARCPSDALKIFTIKGIVVVQLPRISVHDLISALPPNKRLSPMPTTTLL